MNYKLAKELKDATFQQQMLFVAIDELHNDEPTLSELIEACGQDFRDITLHSDGRKIAKSGRMKFGHRQLVKGSSFEDAVAVFGLH